MQRCGAAIEEWTWTGYELQRMGMLAPTRISPGWCVTSCPIKRGRIGLDVNAYRGPVWAIAPSAAARVLSLRCSLRRDWICRSGGHSDSRRASWLDFFVVSGFPARSSSVFDKQRQRLTFADKSNLRILVDRTAAHLRNLYAVRSFPSDYRQEAGFRKRLEFEFLDSAE